MCVLFLFNCVWRFGGDVIGIVVDVFDFVDNLCCGFVKEFMVEWVIICGYIIY